MPTDPPVANEVEVGEAATLTAADEIAPALEIEPLELCDEELEVDGPSEGVDGGVQVGQLVPPFLQLVAKALALASARRADRMMREGFTVGPRCWWWVGGTAPSGA